MIRSLKFTEYLFPLLIIGVIQFLPNWLKAEQPDFTQGDQIPEGYKHDWNLGPTGARGWIYSNRLETSQARQILVTKIEPGSPADATLQLEDVYLVLTAFHLKATHERFLAKRSAKLKPLVN